ncbi:MAG: GNAT family N-acetyltransferase [Lachnospiraceae bacterium]|nr:GNAT family N-acetyltransferase [Lachnospiraceae bacterium]
MKLSYQGDHLIEALLDGRPCFVTKRLLLRPWREADAKDLYRQAKDSSIGPMAGWMPHKNVAESKRIIRDILSGEEQYAILRHEGMECIGSIGITKYRPGDHNYQKDCGEIGYWIGRDHQGEGLMTEAVQCLLKHAFEDLQYTKVWGGVYDGNERSERVLKKCGFRYDHSLAEVPRKQLGDSADEHFCFVTKKMAAQARNRDHRYEEKIL